MSGEGFDRWKGGCLKWVLQKAEPKAGQPLRTIIPLLLYQGAEGRGASATVLLS